MYSRLKFSRSGGLHDHFGFQRVVSVLNGKITVRKHIHPANRMADYGKIVPIRDAQVERLKHISVSIPNINQAISEYVPPMFRLIGPIFPNPERPHSFRHLLIQPRLLRGPHCRIRQLQSPAAIAIILRVTEKHYRSRPCLLHILRNRLWIRFYLLRKAGTAAKCNTYDERKNPSRYGFWISFCVTVHEKPSY